jgi:hypothetical protein
VNNTTSHTGGNLRSLITLIILAISFVSWIFGSGVRSTELKNSASDAYDTLISQKDETMEELESSLQKYDTDLTAEEIYQIDVRFLKASRDGHLTFIELAGACRDLYTCYSNNYNLISMTAEDISSSEQESIGYFRIAYYFFLIVIIAMIAAFVVSVLMMFLGRKKHGPVLYMILSIIGFVLTVLFSLVFNNIYSGTSISVMSIVSVITAIAAVIVWNSLSPKRAQNPMNSGNRVG